MGKIHSKHKIWDAGRLVPAWNRKPKLEGVIELAVRDATEQRLGLRWYLPAATLEAMETEKERWREEEASIPIPVLAPKRGKHGAVGGTESDLIEGSLGHPATTPMSVTGQ